MNPHDPGEETRQLHLPPSKEGSGEETRVIPVPFDIEEAEPQRGPGEPGVGDDGAPADSVPSRLDHGPEAVGDLEPGVDDDLEPVPGSDDGLDADVAEEPDETDLEADEYSTSAYDAYEEAARDDPARDGEASPPEMSQVLFVDVALVLPSTHPVVVLQEADFPYRELRIPVGGAEGVAISYAARRVATPRPLTHEMISDLLDTFSLMLDAVRIRGFHGSNLLAELVVSGASGVRTIDCRPSDAIALCLRRTLPVPIMVAPEVLEHLGGPAASGN